MRPLWQLFGAFFRIGLFTFGGGYAMLPMLRRELVERYRWATEEQLLDYFAIAQCTPGVIAVNTATFVGYRQKGFKGALAATLGVICPSVAIILLIASMLAPFWDLPMVRHAFAGVRAAVGALIVAAVIQLVRGGVKSPLQVILFALSFLCVAGLGLHPAFVLLGAALLGLARVKGGAER